MIQGKGLVAISTLPQHQSGLYNWSHSTIHTSTNFLSNIHTRPGEQLGISIVPKDILTRRVEQPVTEPLIYDLLYLLSYSNNS